MKQDPGCWLSLPASLRHRIAATSSERSSAEDPPTAQSRASCKKSLRFPTEAAAQALKSTSGEVTAEQSQQASTTTRVGTEAPPPPGSAPEVLKIVERVVFGRNARQEDSAATSSVLAKRLNASSRPSSGSALSSSHGADSNALLMQGCVHVLNGFQERTTTEVRS